MLSARSLYPRTAANVKAELRGWWRVERLSTRALRSQRRRDIARPRGHGTQSGWNAGDGARLVVSRRHGAQRDLPSMRSCSLPPLGGCHTRVYPSGITLNGKYGHEYGLRLMRYGEESAITCQMGHGSIHGARSTVWYSKPECEPSGSQTHIDRSATSPGRKRTPALMNARLGPPSSAQPPPGSPTR